MHVLAPLADRRARRVALALLALVAFLGVVAWVVFAEDADDIVEDFSRLGWGLACILLIHVAVMACDGTAWRVLLRGHRPGLAALFLWARWIREAVNLLLPVAQVGGEVVGARFLVLRRMSLRLAGASVIIDKIAEAISLISFTLLGIVLFVALRGETAMSRAIVIASAIPAVAIFVLALAWHVGLFNSWRQRIAALVKSWHWPMPVSLRDVGDALRSIYRADLVAASAGWHLAAWLLGAGEVWLALYFMGHPIGLAEAIVLESLGQAITSAGFMVPAALGVQEGAYIGIGVALGLPAEAALALSLVKRVRQIILGLPALASWQVLEMRALLAKPAGTRAARRVPPPSSNSNAYVRRFTCALLRPFAATPLTPNHVTFLRIATGIAACVACAIGTAAWNHWAAVLWVISAVFDRADGEFARLTHQSSKWGDRLDYYGDVAINALIFLAIGINLGTGPIGEWPIFLGLFAAVSVAAASTLAEELESRIGAKTFPSRSGFDFDDVLFALAPVLWLGFLMPLLVGAAIGAPVVYVFIWRRLSRLAGAPPRPSLKLAR